VQIAGVQYLIKSAEFDVSVLACEEEINEGWWNKNKKRFQIKLGNDGDCSFE
jgi:hypothetical protein